MNRKQKIIVSITGIFLVLMILVGLTYAYFLTKITGNTNEKSISVSTANLVLEYGESTNVVQGISNAEPGYSVEKIFTATNKGNSTVTYGAVLESIVNELLRPQDLVYTLTCTSYLKEGFSLASDGTVTGTIDGTCDGVSTETKFPSTSDLSIMVNNTIDTTHTQAYKLTITYKEMGVDQSTDMNKTFSAKVNIVDLNTLIRTNPYKDNKNSLAYNIINNAMNKVNGTELVSSVNKQITEDTKVLSITSDDYGTSYYYRGNVTDNFINYAGMCWRIVRVEGDGSIKLLLAAEKTCGETNVTTTSGYATASDETVLVGSYGCILINNVGEFNDNYYMNSYENGSVMKKLNDWLSRKVNDNSEITDNEKALLKNDDWCIGDRTSAYDTSTFEKLDLNKTVVELIREEIDFYYSSDIRIGHKLPSLICDGNKEKEGEKITSKVGILTADEVRFAGASSDSYLNKNAQSKFWWTLTFRVAGGNNEYANVVYDDGSMFDADVDNESIAIRPSITLVSDTQISGGNGTISNPYTVK